MCNFDYGTLYGPTGAEWSQTINGDHYIMQRQWDSTANGCTQVPTPNLPDAEHRVSDGAVQGHRSLLCHRRSRQLHLHQRGIDKGRIGGGGNH
jgi:hypothetical protein